MMRKEWRSSILRSWKKRFVNYFLSRREKSTTWIHPQSGYIPTGFVHYVDWSAKRIHPNGIGPIRGLVRTADTSQRDQSTTWIHPQSGYIPTGFVHFVDWSAQRIHPNGISPLRGLVRKADMSKRDSSTSWIRPKGKEYRQT